MFFIKAFAQPSKGSGKKSSKKKSNNNNNNNSNNNGDGRTGKTGRKRGSQGEAIGRNRVQSVI